MSKRKKNKHKNKQKPQKNYIYETKHPDQINQIALKVFGSLYYNSDQVSF